MSKIKKADLLQLVQEQADMVVELAGMVEKNKQSIIKLENEREKPKLKTLDQSVFDGLDEKWRFAAVDDDGRSYAFMRKPEIDETDPCFIDGDTTRCKWVGEGYDASNWQNSLIERESKELTGSELCRAMLKRGDRFVMCMAGDGTDVIYDLACFVSSTHPYIGRLDNYRAVTPINNQGEPLTQAEAGL